MRSLLTSCVVLVTLSASFDSLAQLYPQPQLQPPPAANRQSGDTTQAQGSGVQTYQRYGNTSYGSNGETYQHYGNTAYGTNGQISQRSGNTTLRSGQQIGNAGFGSNGRICQSMGNVTYCQ